MIINPAQTIDTLADEISNLRAENKDLKDMIQEMRAAPDPDVEANELLKLVQNRHKTNPKPTSFTGYNSYEEEAATEERLSLIEAIADGKISWSVGGIWQDNMVVELDLADGFYPLIVECWDGGAVLVPVMDGKLYAHNVVNACVEIYDDSHNANPNQRFIEDVVWNGEMLVVSMGS